MARDPNAEREVDADLRVRMGFTQGISLITRRGVNSDIDAGTLPEDIWEGGGVYTGFPITGVAETLQVFSSSASDAAAGVGARSVRITGLDSNYLPITEDVTLNGVTPVVTLLTFWRVDMCFVITSGSSVFNVGTITARHSTTTANVFSVIPIGTNLSSNAVYTVPANKSILIKRLVAQLFAGATDQILIRAFIRAFGMPPTLSQPFALGNAALFASELAGNAIPEKTDIVFRAMSTTGSNLVAAVTFDFYLMDNT